jgi:hypothetical protein
LRAPREAKLAEFRLTEKKENISVRQNSVHEPFRRGVWLPVRADRRGRTVCRNRISCAKVAAGTLRV